MVLVPSATAGGGWYSRAWWRVSVRINAPAARGGLRTVELQPSVTVRRSTPIRSRAECRQAVKELATSTARRIAAATWIMSRTTVASRATRWCPQRSRWSRGGAYRPRSAPAAGSARHRADAGRRDRAARSPDPQPASCRRSFRRGYPARAAPSTRTTGVLGRTGSLSRAALVVSRSLRTNAGPAGAVPVRVRSRSSAGLRWRRGRLWHPRTASRAREQDAYPVVRAITGLSTPERRGPEGSAPEGADRRYLIGKTRGSVWSIETDPRLAGRAA